MLIKEKLGIQSGAGIPQLQTVGTLTDAQLTEIAEIKMPDLNANDIDAAKEIIAGTARSMGEMKKKYEVTRKLAALLKGESVDEGEGSAA